VQKETIVRKNFC